MDWSDVNGFDLSEFAGKHETAIDALKETRKKDIRVKKLTGSSHSSERAWAQTRIDRIEVAMDLIEADKPTLEEIKDIGAKVPVDPCPAPTEPCWQLYQWPTGSVSMVKISKVVIDGVDELLMYEESDNFSYTALVRTAEGKWGPKVKEWKP